MHESAIGTMTLCSCHVSQALIRGRGDARQGLTGVPRRQHAPVPVWRVLRLQGRAVAAAHAPAAHGLQGAAAVPTELTAAACVHWRSSSLMRVLTGHCKLQGAAAAWHCSRPAAAEASRAASARLVPGCGGRARISTTRTRDGAGEPQLSSSRGVLTHRRLQGHDAHWSPRA